MMMNDTVARIVEIMFQDVEMNEEVSAIRDEVMNNCQERYIDLVKSGMSDDDAIAAVIESLKGMEDVLAPYKKKQHVSTEETGTGRSEQQVSFAACMVQKIDAVLVSEGIKIEPSEDDSYHVSWDADEAPLVSVDLQNGVLRVKRMPGDTVKKNRDGESEYQYKDDGSYYDAENMSDFVHEKKGKIEIDLNSIERLVRSIGNTMKDVFSNVCFNYGCGDGEVTIQIPKATVSHVKLVTISGDISVQHAALIDLNVTSTSGDIGIDLSETQRLQRIDLRTTSGDINVSAFADSIKISSTSGDVEVEGRITNVSVSTISGDIDIRADVVNMTFKAISGDVDLTFDSDEIREVRGSTISGDIDIDLPDGIGAIAINTQSRSGDVTTRHHTNGYGPMVNGNVSSMSGDITIR